MPSIGLEKAQRVHARPTRKIETYNLAAAHLGLEQNCLLLQPVLSATQPQNDSPRWLRRPGQSSGLRPLAVKRRPRDWPQPRLWSPQRVGPSAAAPPVESSGRPSPRDTSSAWISRLAE